ncbi:MAG: LysR family transcriptional regulator [Pirellulales bacterium]
MPRSSPRNRPYKELTLQQLRSFAETARLGSMAAAAKSLGLTHPTVREQVLALEREFALKLVVPYGRGCRLTVEGRQLAELATPLTTGAASLKARFEALRSQAKVRLVVAGPPRVLQEDLPAAVDEALRNEPRLSLAFLELRDDQVVEAVASGAADIGLTTRVVPADVPLGVTFETAYELETLLLAPKQHPLARRRTVKPSDLRHYPMLSSRYTLSDQPELAAMLDRHRAFDGPPPRIEPFLAGTVRRYVEQGLGIAVVYGPPPKTRGGAVHERSMSRYFGRGLVRFAFRNGGPHEDFARLFAEQVRKAHAAK